AEAAQAAFAVTYYHWGLHPWGIYALVSLGLAFFAYNRGLPLTNFNTITFRIVEIDGRRIAMCPPAGSRPFINRHPVSFEVRD
ncbi:hypothetical protein C2W62_54075, partial [Candidatus Entotheonella serta]